jgi:hypothetical protein
LLALLHFRLEDMPGLDAELGASVLFDVTEHFPVAGVVGLDKLKLQQPDMMSRPTRVCSMSSASAACHASRSMLTASCSVRSAVPHNR